GRGGRTRTGQAQGQIERGAALGSARARGEDGGGMTPAFGFRLSAFGLALVAVAACDPARPKPGNGDELTIVVQADRRELEAQEKAIKQREEALKSEQGEIDRRIKELATSRVAADLEHKRRL